MTMRLIDSEHEMEEAINYTVNLVRNCGGNKDITFTFPSKEFSRIFLTNLAATFFVQKLAPVKGLHINVFIPEDDLDDEDEFEFDFDSD